MTPTATARETMRRYMRLITGGGCLAMVFVTCTGSPVTTDFLRDLGATEFQFGLLGGIPMILLALQFFGAHVSGHVARRKPLFMFMLIGGRLLYLPAAFLPLLFPHVHPAVWVYTFIACAAACGGMNNFATPLWFAWMGDLIPRKVLNRYWAERHRFLQMTWMFAYLAVAGLTFVWAGIPSRIVFPILAVVGVIAGVIDIILFMWVHEPENVQTGSRHPWELLTEPLRHREYRSLVAFNCAFSATTMFAAAFMQIYVLKILQVPRWETILIWSMVGLGSAFISRTWGRLADRHGHRPILIICVALKPIAALVFLLVTRETALPLLAPFFVFDSMVNSGYFLAVNGYTLKTAPRENRSMFIAATMALAGIAGGLASIASGAFLKFMAGFEWHAFGRTWINYHLVFFISLVLRLVCIPLAARVREPASSSTAVVLANLMGLWPLRMLTFPVGLYRSGRRKLGENRT